MWSTGGLEFIHSLKEGVDWLDSVKRLDVIPSHIIKIIKKILIIDKKDPKEDTIFQCEKALGKSEYRRGIPFKPKKCWGKKVRFTPINIE